MKRGQIWTANLGSGEGSEQMGFRPVLIIQNDVGNKYSPTIIVATITDNRKRKMPTHVDIDTSCGLKKDSVILLEQIRTISKTRFREYVGYVSEVVMEEVNYALGMSAGVVPVPTPKVR